jgi:hypothetical protein
MTISPLRKVCEREDSFGIILPDYKKAKGVPRWSGTREQKAETVSISTEVGYTSDITGRADGTGNREGLSVF